MARTVKKEDVTYCVGDKKLFWIAGYMDSQTANVDEIIRGLGEARDAFAQAYDLRRQDVCTYEILSSRRYKNMRVFFIETDTCPEGVLQLTNHETMHEFLTA